MRIVGLDLAGVETRPTGFCILRGMQAETCLVYTDTEIIQKTIDANPKIVAIDAPLCLPPGRKSIEERTNNAPKRKRPRTVENGNKTFPNHIGSYEKTNRNEAYSLKNILRSSKVNGD